MIQTKELIYEYEKRDEEGNIIGMKRAIDGVDIDIPEGSFVAILGHNGSGKSTLAKHMNAILVPSGGTMWVNGRDTKDPENLWDVRQSAGMVFQNPDNQIIGTVVEEDVGFGPENLGVPADEIWKRVEESLKDVGMLEYRKSSPNKLSGGQKQRVAIAGVIAMEPKCIVLDEPTSFLDIRHKIELLDILQDMAVRDKVAVIVSLHEIELAAKVADYVMCIGTDKTIEFARPESIFTDERISRLYGLTQGTYNSLYGSAELKRPQGKAHVFVVGGAGTGVFTYRELQRAGIAFLAGIIYENDCEYPVAKSLAKDVIVNRMFEPIDEETYKKACAGIDETDYVIDTGCQVGAMNKRLKDLIEYAKKQGKKVLVKPDREALRQLV